MDKYCLTDAYPDPPNSRAGSALRQILFPKKAATYVRQNADRYDVIDCLIGTLPFAKSSLRFRGLVVARSVGLFRLYDRFLREAARVRSKHPEGRWFGRIFHRFIEKRARKDSERSLRTCDVVNFPNEDEKTELAQDPNLTVSALVEPYGLNDGFLDSLAAAGVPAADRLRHPKICFIGMWGPRKGSREWPRIVKTIWERHPNAEFFFLGTMFSESIVRADLGLTETERISCQPTFAGAELPSLLADCTIGIFPSHIEGFGLAVLEQLAAGLPTIAYDVPGPRQILRTLAEQLLVPIGDVAALGARASEILSLGVADYEKLSNDCRAVARTYRWREIAANTVRSYRTALDSLD